MGKAWAAKLCRHPAEGLVHRPHSDAAPFAQE